MTLRYRPGRFDTKWIPRFGRNIRKRPPCLRGRFLVNPPLYWMTNRTSGKGAKMEIRPMFVVGIMLLGSAAAQQPAAPQNPPASPAKAQATAPAKAQPTPAAKLPDAPKSQGSAAFATPKER